jgi:hypothetical protein
MKQGIKTHCFFYSYETGLLVSLREKGMLVLKALVL